MNLLQLIKKRKRAEESRMGLIFIPDISGFTALVRSTEHFRGKDIMVELLSALINSNRLGLRIAEIEGDAIFFYRWGVAPPITEIMDQFHQMKIAFDHKRRELEFRYGVPLNIQLKAVAHYGEFSGFSMGGFQKLYGQVVVEAHSLLKNQVPEKSYLLVTDELQKAEPAGTSQTSEGTWVVSQLCELYAGLRQICFTYLVDARPSTLTR